MEKFLLDEFVDVPAPLGFDGWLSFWLILVISLVNGILMLFVGYKFLQVLQLSGYKARGYFSWLKDTKGRYVGRLIMLSFLSTAALLITNVLLKQFFVYKILTYLGLVFYFLFSVIFILNMYNAPQKVPLKYTKRMNRLCGVLFIVVAATSFFILTASELYIEYLSYAAIGLTPIFLPLLVLIAYYITLPFELLNSHKYIKRAKKKLSENKDLIVIGITGSYGKTSVKTILTTMLSEKYKVCSSPYSYNTPLGLAKTILENLSQEHEIFVAEMGAKYEGDIIYLCDMVKPSIGLITGIGNQHLATFGSIEKLIKTKSEIISGLRENGKAYINVDSQGALSLYEANNGDNVFAVGLSYKNTKVMAKNIATSATGTSFDLEVAGKSCKVSTSMLGKHNVSNILLAASVALDLGVSVEELKQAIGKLTPPPHRLAILPSNNSLIVIDDAYNGSVEGSKAALDVLAGFEGKKIVITPGLVELGSEEYISNYNLGKDMAKVADFVIINGTVNYDAISSGLVDSGLDKDKILRAGSLSQAVEVLGKISSPGDVVLFENDLPDNYT